MQTAVRDLAANHSVMREDRSQLLHTFRLARYWTQYVRLRQEAVQQLQSLQHIHKQLGMYINQLKKREREVSAAKLRE